MDFLQTNLTELLQLIKQGVTSNNRRPVEILPNVEAVDMTENLPNKNLPEIDPVPRLISTGSSDATHHDSIQPNIGIVIIHL